VTVKVKMILPALLEPLWDVIIRSRRVSAMLPLLETTLDAFGRARGRATAAPATVRRPELEIYEP
jgi:hypothetical protein